MMQYLTIYEKTLKKATEKHLKQSKFKSIKFKFKLQQFPKITANIMGILIFRFKSQLSLKSCQINCHLYL